MNVNNGQCGPHFFPRDIFYPYDAKLKNRNIVESTGIEWWSYLAHHLFHVILIQQFIAKYGLTMNCYNVFKIFQ